LSGKLLAALQIELRFSRESHQRKEAKTLSCCSSKKVQYSKLQTLLDQEITEPLEDVSKIEEDLVASWELSRQYDSRVYCGFRNRSGCRRSTTKESGIGLWKRGNFPKSATESYHACEATEARAEEISRKPHRMESGIVRVCSSQES